MIATILSCVSITISITICIFTLVQNRKIHNENKLLTSKPNLEVELLWDSKIGGQIVKKEYAIDSWSVWESKYTPFYKDGDIHIFENNNVQTKPAYTICIKNTGFGAANQIIVKRVKYVFDDSEIFSIDCSEIAFTNVAVGQTAAKKIFCKVPEVRFDKVFLKLEYYDVNKNKYEKEFKYIDSQLNKNLTEY